MPKIHVSKSMMIKADINKISSSLQDFNQWKLWSPWLVQEPGAIVEVRADGKSYSWNGKRIGSGEMAITNVEDNRLDYDLTFLRPWKSKAKVSFVLKGNESETKVTWLMDSSMPFFLFWMKKMMVALVGLDYTRGLEMLKDLLELGTVKSKLEFEGIVEYPGCKYIAIKADCTNEEIGEKMGQDFKQLSEFIKEKNIEPSELPFSIYHKMNFVKGTASYTAGIPVAEIPERLGTNIISGELPKMKVYSIKHTGPYRHLGNPWSAAVAMLRAKEFKPKKGVHPFEIYLNDPNDTEETKLETRICYAVD